MTESPRLVAVGISNGTTVYADATNLGSAVPVKVTLTADYSMLQPDGPYFVGFPFRPQYTGAATPQYPHLIANGSTISLLAGEADALVTAGGATFA